MKTAIIYRRACAKNKRFKKRTRVALEIRIRQTEFAFRAIQNWQMLIVAPGNSKHISRSTLLSTLIMKFNLTSAIHSLFRLVFCYFVRLFFVIPFNPNNDALKSLSCSTKNCLHQDNHRLKIEISARGLKYFLVFFFLDFLVFSLPLARIEC